MKTDCALYVKVLPDGQMERELVTINGKTCLESTTVEQEIINFSELEFGPYAAIVDLLAYSASNLSVEGRVEEVDVEEFQFLLNTANDLVTSLESEHPLHGTLTRTALEDQVPDDDGTGLYIYRAADRILTVCSEAIILQMQINEILSDMRKGKPLDIKKKHAYLQMLAFTQVFEFGEGWTSRYRFRSLTDYYYFLLIHFVKQNPTVSLCECCGRYFIPKTKKRTLYCDRVLRDGKTCKDIAPSLKHKLQAQSKKVIEEFDRAKRRMYKRYERTDDTGAKPANKNLSYADYYAWLDRATQARDSYLAGKMKEEDALRLICIE